MFRDEMSKVTMRQEYCCQSEKKRKLFFCMCRTFRKVFISLHIFFYFFFSIATHYGMTNKLAHNLKYKMQDSRFCLFCESEKCGLHIDLAQFTSENCHRTLVNKKNKNHEDQGHDLTSQK